jgi:ribosome-associated heat shock protein Hsp15
VEEARVDQWLWAVRMYKTRSAATDACRARRVVVNGAVAKAATHVRPGDRIEARTPGGVRVLEVVRAIDKRVGAASAAECLLDHTPAPLEMEAPVFGRERGEGRPTKRDRRELDRLRR